MHDDEHLLTGVLEVRLVDPEIPERATRVVDLSTKDLVEVVRVVRRRRCARNRCDERWGTSRQGLNRFCVGHFLREMSGRSPFYGLARSSATTEAKGAMIPGRYA